MLHVEYAKRFEKIRLIFTHAKDTVCAYSNTMGRTHYAYSATQRLQRTAINVFQ